MSLLSPSPSHDSAETTTTTTAHIAAPPCSPKKGTDESLCESTDDDSFYEDAAWLFESSKSTEPKVFVLPNNIRVVLNLIVNDELPESVMSGCYLWPAALNLANYLVTTTTARRKNAKYTSIVELGAGCGLVSLTALQVFQETLQWVLLTDHDPTTLSRARDNLESTLLHTMDATDTDDTLNEMINNLSSIPVLFEPLEWGDQTNSHKLQRVLEQHTGSLSSFARADLVVGSDLFGHVTDISKILYSARDLGRAFLYAQSFGMSTEAIVELERVLHLLEWEQVVLVDEPENWIVEFRPQQPQQR